MRRPVFEKLLWLAVLPLLGGAGPPSKPAIDPQAKSLVQAMSDFLGNQPQLSVHAKGSTEVVLKSGEKIEMDHSSDVRVKRPNAMRSDREGEKVDLSFFYDGRTFTLVSKEKGNYAIAAAPPTLDAAIDTAREKLGIEAPGADLLYSKPYDALMEDVVGGTYVGKVMLDGTPCHHLAFRGNESDWQIWIEDGPRPLPRKLVITSKKVQGEPEFRVALSQWNMAPKFDDTTFRFTPPPGATRIDFLPPSGAHPTGGSR
jgi:hypothetical protein